MPSRKDDRRELVETLARSIRRDRGTFIAELARRTKLDSATAKSETDSEDVPPR
jgi:predicted translin family RNA/ssDNA-binding protein